MHISKIEWRTQLTYLPKLGCFAFLILTQLGCTTSLPSSDKPKTYSITATADTKLGKLLATSKHQHPDSSAVIPLTRGLDAFVARLVLIDNAEKTIDLQYYIYRDDSTGKILAWKLLQAAKRGVRVRLLLDDLGTGGIDDELAAIDNHPNIELRLFNPFVNRGRRLLELLGNFDRATRRMHNKSLTVDNQVTIVGGRNIGDEYFDANTSVSFGDFDLMTIGPVVSDVSTQFDLYWNSDGTYTANQLIDHTISPEQQHEKESTFENTIRSLNNSPYIHALKQSKLVEDIRSNQLHWYWGKVTVLYDKPNKIKSLPEQRNELMVYDLLDELDKIKSSALIVSPYFVPGKRGTKRLSAYSRSGLEITVVTNSLAATDVVAVHGGYAKYRKQLLSAGVRIFETKVNTNNKPGHWTGSSRVSLHAKTFVLDKEKVFVGSFNFDPRSALLNTEMGLLVHSPELAQDILTNSAQALKKYAYRLELKDELLWYDDTQNTTTTHEPDASIWRRIGATFSRWLPIEKQL